MKTQERLFGILLTSHCNLQVRGHFDRLVQYSQKGALLTETVIPKGGHGKKGWPERMRQMADPCGQPDGLHPASTVQC